MTPTGRDDAALMEITDLSVSFPAGDGSMHRAVDGVSLSVGRGRALAVVGESASGKSVTVRAALQLLPKTAHIPSGRALFDGIDMLHARPRVLRAVRGRRIGMVFQNAMDALNPTITVGRQISEVLVWHRLCSRSEARRRAIATLGAVGIPNPERRASMYPFQLSGGLRQRAMVAMAIVAEPDLLIADEPTTALDMTVQAQLLDLLAEITSGGTGLVMITHDLGVARRLCDDLVVMKAGRIVERGPLRAVFDNPQESYTRKLLDSSIELGGDHVRRVTTAGGAAAEQATSPPLLVCRGLRKTFHTSAGLTTAVDGVDLTILPGTTFGLVGESGSGKSTVARLVMGLHEPDEGDVIFDGIDTGAADSRPARRRMQMVFQNPYSSLIPQFTAGENIMEAMRLQGRRADRAAKDRVAELLDLVGLPPEAAHRYPRQFSGGQQQRIAIARALAPEPRLLVCDEPTSALDASIQSQVLDLLEELKDRLGLALLLISHNLGVVERMADTVAVMKDGRILESGSREQIFAYPTHPYTRALLDAVLPVREPDAAKLRTGL